MFSSQQRLDFDAPDSEASTLPHPPRSVESAGWKEIPGKIRRAKKLEIKIRETKKLEPNGVAFGGALRRMLPIWDRKGFEVKVGCHKGELWKNLGSIRAQGAGPVANSRDLGNGLAYFVVSIQ